jgi:hypothetical protein
MDIRIIINSLIILFILHIIILNINYHIVIGKKTNVENFAENNIENTNDKSMNFLMNNNSNDEFKQKLLKYMQQNDVVKETEFENKNINKVSPVNTYLSDNNEPNFESNVADISKFYKFNYDNLNEDQLKSTSIENLNKTNTTKEYIEPDNEKNCQDNKNYGRKSVKTPDNWEYKNELPMNGGTMNGIVGFDTLESQFAIYNPNKLNIQSPTENNFNNIPHNDLRKPIVYEN